MTILDGIQIDSKKYYSDLHLTEVEDARLNSVLKRNCNTGQDSEVRLPKDIRLTSNTSKTKTKTVDKLPSVGGRTRFDSPSHPELQQIASARNAFSIQSLYK